MSAIRFTSAVIAAIFVIFTIACDDTPPNGAMKNTGTTTDPCEDFSRWEEIPSPFDGERCFAWESMHTDESGVICKRSESVFLKTCADPQKRPDQKPPDPPKAQ